MPELGGDVARDDVEERRLAGAVRAEDGAPLAVRDVEVDVAHGVEAAVAPADPPQAEDRLGVFGCCRVRQSVTPVTFGWISFPIHGSDRFTHCGKVRPGAGVFVENVPPNVWSTPGTSPTVLIASLPSLVIELLVEDVDHRLAVLVQVERAVRRGELHLADRRLELLLAAGDVAADRLQALRAGPTC